MAGEKVSNPSDTECYAVDTPNRTHLIFGVVENLFTKRGVQEESIPQFREGTMHVACYEVCRGHDESINCGSHPRLNDDLNTGKILLQMRSKPSRNQKDGARVCRCWCILDSDSGCARAGEAAEGLVSASTLGFHGWRYFMIFFCFILLEPRFRRL